MVYTDTVSKEQQLADWFAIDNHLRDGPIAAIMLCAEHGFSTFLKTILDELDNPADYVNKTLEDASIRDRYIYIAAKLICE